MTNLDEFAALVFSGDKADQLLHGQATADLLAVAPQAACFTAFCNPAGRMLANGIMIRQQTDRFVYVAAKPCVEILDQTIQRILPFFRVSVERLDQVYGCADGTPHGYFPADGCCGICLHPPQQCDRLSQRAWLAAWWQRGVVFIRRREDSAQFIPHETGWDRLAVSYTKGCYTGQEIIARVYYRGNPKTRFMAGRSSTSTTDRELLNSNGVVCGRLIDSMQLADATLIAASVQKSAIATDLQINGVPIEWCKDFIQPVQPGG